jgi:hypothetical protein
VVFRAAQGPCFTARVGDLELRWQQNHLEEQPNLVASALAGVPICGDCLVAVSGAAAADELLADIAARRRQRRRRGDSAQQSSQTLAAAGVHNARPYFSASQTRPAPSRPAVERPHAPPQTYACEPRQQLMWALAGRATSISFDPSPAPPRVVVVEMPDLRQGGALDRTAAEPARGSAELSRWCALPPEIVGAVIAAGGEILRRCSRVCASLFQAGADCDCVGVQETVQGLRALRPRSAGRGETR